MESQQDDSQIVDMVYLDHAFRHFPDQEIAATIRRQILLGCKVVEEKQGEVLALQADVQDLKRSLETKLAELEVQEEALKKEKANHQDQQRELADELARFNDLTKDLPSRVDDFIKMTQEGFRTLKSCASDVTDKVEAHVKATSVTEEAGRLLNRDISTKLKDLSVSTERNKGDLSVIKDQSVVMATVMDSVKEAHKRIESSLNDGVTMEDIKAEIEPLVELGNAVKTLAEGLPTRESLETRLAQVEGRNQQVRDLQVEVNRLARENQILVNRNKSLTTERDNARNLSEQAKTVLEELDETVNVKNSKIEEVQKASDDLLNRLIEANSQISRGEEARRKLDDVQPVLQTAEINRQELAEVKSRLQQAEQTGKGMEQKITDLHCSLDREKELHNGCSARLTQALSNNSNILLKMTKLEDDCSVLRKELTQFRSQETVDLQQQMKNQWATVEEALQKQLSDECSHEETILKLNTAWDSERRVLQGQIERQNEELDRLQSRLSRLEPLAEQLQTAQYEARDVQRKLTASESKADQFQKDYEEAETKICSLTGQLEALQHEVDDSTGTIKSLEEKLIAAEDELSSQQSHQCVTVPQGVLGDLAKVYLRLADLFSDIPVVPETEEGLDMAVIAVDMASLLDGPEANDNLTTFLNSDLQGWHCLRQVIDGEPDSEVESGDIACDYHKDHGKICTMVRVVQWDTPRLEFHQTR